MSAGTEQLVRRELSSGERLIWSGIPRQGLRLRASDATMIPFSLLWGGFAVFWEYSVLQEGNAPFFFALWGVPFVIIGIYMIVGRFLLDSFQRARTQYGITDQRVLILTGLMNREVKSLQLRNLSEITLQERSDQSGTILFGPSSAVYAIWSGTYWPGMSRKIAPSFDLLDDARKVYEILKSSQQQVQ